MTLPVLKRPRVHAMVSAMRRITRIDVDLVRPPHILYCERMPFVVLVGAVVFVTVVFFGITFHGLIAAFILMATGVGVLRQLFAHDPHFFAVYAKALKYPRRLPAVPDAPMPDLPRGGHWPPSWHGGASLAFIGYADRPRISGSLRANPRAR